MIVIEGQIGAGKTTVGIFLSENLGIPLHRELKNDMTLSLLEKFYANQYRWSLTMQIHFLNERFCMIKEIFRNGRGILDRSLFGDRIFADVLHKQEKITKEEYIVYMTLLENMIEYAPLPTLMVYLDCSVDTVMERILKRNRDFELGISRDYLEILNGYYLKWFESYDYSPKIRIDYNNFDISQKENQEKFLHIVAPYLKN